MTQQQEKTYQLVQDINDAIYSMDSHFIKVHQHLVTDDLSAKQMILIDFIKKNSNVTIGQIAQFLNITSSAVGQLVSKLEEQNYLSRQINSENRREIFVQLDVAGVKYFEKEEEIKRYIVSKYYSKLEMSELEQLKYIIEKLNGIVLKERAINEE
ncbi:hypothetical protein AEA09_06005 [Lysinibacillus contaminans]|uniref:HTH marR-type domain-containing protein n=1 Tax=Lysinibacillus contaminans TaxID=1293441 RepID=A0ABR5JZT9_9BACI|nr:MarR family transcriptional regulator [Lysinibacillus contaminans]KOS68151.1 hypothetical protein AEA09_06005 [Lysinibacillus contaminans]